jgi:2-haloacid dehalogenase
MMCAAHNYDLRAARSCGLKTAFIARPSEYGIGQTTDLFAEEDWDVVATDIRDLAEQMGT